MNYQSFILIFTILSSGLSLVPPTLKNLEIIETLSLPKPDKYLSSIDNIGEMISRSPLCLISIIYYPGIDTPNIEAFVLQKRITVAEYYATRGRIQISYIAMKVSRKPLSQTTWEDVLDKTHLSSQTRWTCSINVILYLPPGWAFGAGPLRNKNEFLYPGRPFITGWKSTVFLGYVYIYHHQKVTDLGVRLRRLRRLSIPN